MKITVETQNAAGILQRTQVFLNGVEQTGCIEADDEAGYLVRYQKQNGQLILADGEILTERVMGFVEIKIKD